MTGSVKRASVGSTYSSKKKRRSESSIDSSDSEDSSAHARHAKSSKSRSSHSKSDKKLSRSRSRDEDDGSDAKSDQDSNADENEEEEEEEYEVKTIKAHRHKNGELVFRVGWKGYGSDDDSWEPERNLTGAKELLKTYKLENDLGSSKSKSGRLSGASSKSASKRSANGDGSDTDASHRAGDSKKRKRSEKEVLKSSIAPLRKNGSSGPTKADRESVKNRKKEAAEYDSDADSMGDDDWHAHHLDRPSWESLVRGIRTIDRETSDDADGVTDSSSIKVCLLWHSGRTSWVPNKIARAKLPQKLLDFYENHLQFSAVE